MTLLGKIDFEQSVYIDQIDKLAECVDMALVVAMQRCGELGENAADYKNAQEWWSEVSVTMFSARKAQLCRIAESMARSDILIIEQMLAPAQYVNLASELEPGMKAIVLLPGGQPYGSWWRNLPGGRLVYELIEKYGGRVDESDEAWIAYDELIGDWIDNLDQSVVHGTVEDNQLCLRWS